MMGPVRVPFRREKNKPLSFGQLAVTLYASYSVSSAALQSLTERSEDGANGGELRGPALARARQAAQLNRRAFEAVMYMGLRDALPAGWLPLGALGAFARVIYGLVAIAETPPEPEALLGADELRALAIQSRTARPARSGWPRPSARTVLIRSLIRCPRPRWRSAKRSSPTRISAMIMVTSPTRSF
jgi:hypothetical protein